MRLPQFNELPNSKEMLEEFGGYNHNLRINNGEWYDEKNMTTDFYPAASTRAKRIKVASIEDRAIGQLGLTLKGYYDSVVVSDNEGDNRYWTLRNLYEGTSRVGKWFESDFETPLSHYGATASEIKAKAALFTNDQKSKLVPMGSYLCAFPDGVVLETANTTDSLPVFKIARKNTSALTTISIAANTLAVATGGDNKYIDISTSPSGYRYEDKQIQYYLSEEKVWVNQPTCVCIYTGDIASAFGTGLFDGFNVGDVVTIEGTLSSGRLIDGIFGNVDTNSTATAKVKILEKGTMTTGDNKNPIPNFSGTADYIIVEGFVYHGASGVNLYLTSLDSATVERKTPEISFACESQNRIWACDKLGHEIYASALGNPYNFYDYSGLSTDSYAVNVGTAGKWTGCVNYNGMPLFFKEDAVHIISGSYPTNLGQLDGGSYSVTTRTNFNGCAAGSENSFAVIDNILYYHSPKGIVAFDGTNTAIVSEALGNRYYSNAVAGTDGKKYYVSMLDDFDNKYHLFVYDTKKGTWSKEDNTQLVDAFTMSSRGMAYVPNAKDGVYVCLPPYDDEIVFSGVDVEDDVEWMCETGVYGYSYPNSKYISRLQVRLQIAAGATASIYIQYDSDGVWHKKGEFSTKGTQTYLLPIVPIRCDHMKLKFEGKGDVKIISIAKILEEGGDVT